MATKTIKTNVTLHVPAEDHVPFEIDSSGARVSGNYSIVAKPPGAEVELDADEADAILQRHGGEEIVAKPTVAAAAQKPSKDSK